MNYICIKNDWDHEVIDALLVVGEEEFYMKAFDEVEWREAEEFAEKIANSLNIEFIGNVTDT